MEAISLKRSVQSLCLFFSILSIPPDAVAAPIDPAFAQQAYVKASNPEAEDFFGHSVALDGNTMVVGAWGEDSAASGSNGDDSDNSIVNSGAVYVFVRSGSGWIQQAYLKASNPGSNDNFGISVAISGDTIVVGAPSEDGDGVGVNGPENDSASHSGAAYVFVRSGGTWTQQAYLKASNTGAGDNFGESVAIDGDTVIVGASDEDSASLGVNGDGSNNSATGSGAAYVFVREGITWTQQAYLKASNTAIQDTFGVSVGINGDTAVVGASWEDGSATGINGDQSDNSASEAGAVYVYVRNAGTWTQQAYVKASNASAADRFGEAVAISGATIVVGADGEDSAATGVDGDGTNNDASNSGAAYVFVRTNDTWSQQAYLKASNTEASDLFGMGVAVDGNRVLVGAYFEDSAARGIDGPGDDNSAPYSGAAYLFEESGGVWSQRSYLKASNTEEDDIFGFGVAVSGDTFIASAMQESSSASGVNGDQSDNSALYAGTVYVFSGAPPRLTLTRPRAFPGTPVGKRARPQTLQLANPGGTTATGITARLSGRAAKDFRLTRPAATLAPGATTSFRATFRPRTKGARKATLTVRAGNAAATSVPLKGRGR